MEYLSGVQIEPQRLESFRFDLIIAVTGKDDRSVHLLKNYSVSSSKKVALNYQNNGFERKKDSNSVFFTNNGFEILETEAGNTKILSDLVENLIKSNNGEKTDILIDYSCMASETYAALINLIETIDVIGTRVNIYFSYTQAKFVKSKKIKSVKNYNSLFPGRGLSQPEKPTCLIVGMGLHEDYNQFIKDKINPESILLFYSDPAPDGYVETIFSNNQELIEMVDIKNLHSYPINNLNETVNKLTDICINLRLRYNIIILPLGPKVFTLLSLLLAVRYPDIDVWNISNTKIKQLNKKIAGQPPVVFKVRYENQNE
jgi:hypothetical protein